MSFLLSSSRDIVCSVSECLSWIFVLLNFLSIFYLTFCMFYKINKVVKIMGYAWAGCVTVVSTIIVAVHTCLFTIVCAAFTGLMLFGLLYVMLKSHVGVVKVIAPAKKEEPVQIQQEIQEEPEFVENFVGMEVTAEEAEDYNEYIDELLKDVDFGKIEPIEEVVEEIQEPVIQEPVVEEKPVPETYIFDDERGVVVEPEKNEVQYQSNVIVAKDVVEEKVEPQPEPEVKEPVVEEMIVPVHNKFTDIIVSQIEGMPEMEEKSSKSREQLVKELENRPVMVKFQQVNFNTNGDEKKTRVKPKKEEEKPVEKPKIRGYQIETFLND